MVELREPRSAVIRRWAIITIVVAASVALAIGAQWKSRGLAEAKCAAMYADTHTAGDSLQVDNAQPNLGSREKTTAVTCGVIRRTQAGK